LLVASGGPPGPVWLAGDATVAERPGPQVFGKGRHRAGGRSPPPPRDTAYRWGHQGGVVSGLVTCPWATRPWALPGLVAGYRDPAGEQAQGTHHHPPAPLARRLVARVLRWFPARQCRVVGDTGDGPSETARCCRRYGRQRTWGSKVDGDAALTAPRPPSPLGRPRVQGPQRASPHPVVAHTAERPRLTVAWSGGRTRASEGVTGTGHGDRLGEALLAVRWRDVQDGPGTPREAEGVPTAVPLKPPPMGACDTPRWSMEPTFQECRAYVTRESTTGDRQQPV
jgi:hypothetical protein